VIPADSQSSSENFPRNSEHRRKLAVARRLYGPRHKALRREFAKQVATGSVRCARCGGLISPDEPFDLGHSDYDRSLYNGAEHVSCSRGAPHRNRTSREW
jgi:hypothetical protein